MTRIRYRSKKPKHFHPNKPKFTGPDGVLFTIRYDKKPVTVATVHPRYGYGVLCWARPFSGGILAGYRRPKLEEIK